MAAPFPRPAVRLAAGLAAGATLLLTGCFRRVTAAAPAAPPQRLVAPPFDPHGAEQLDGPERDRWQKAEVVVRTLRIRPGNRVADIGSGTGYLLPPLSRAVGPRGKVYAEEIQETFLADLERHRRRLGNVEVVHGTPEDPRLPAASVDLFVMLTVYHEVRQPGVLLKKLREAARPGARLAIIDFDPDRKGDPPPPKEHSVRERNVLREAEQAGWKLAERHEVVPSQFFLVLQ